MVPLANLIKTISNKAMDCSTAYPEALEPLLIITRGKDSEYALKDKIFSFAL